MAQASRTVWDRVRQRIRINPETGCWEWIGATNPGGYGLVWAQGRNRLVHRLSYECHRGSIPEGAQLDHLCRVRHCANPAHLEPVTCRTNLLRGDTIAARNRSKTHCPKGHEYTEANTYVTKAGRRQCRTCTRERQKALAAK